MLAVGPFKHFLAVGLQYRRMGLGGPRFSDLWGYQYWDPLRSDLNPLSTEHLLCEICNILKAFMYFDADFSRVYFVASFLMPCEYSQIVNNFCEAKGKKRLDSFYMIVYFT